MKRLEQIAAVIVLALAATAVAGSSGLAFWSQTSPGPRFMPIAVASVCAVLAVLLLIDVARRGKDGEDRAVDWPDRPGAVRSGLTAAAVVLFIALVPWLGFVVGSAVFVVAVLLLVLRRALVPSLMTAAITAALIQGVFVSWLGTALPRGILGI